MMNVYTYLSYDTYYNNRSVYISHTYSPHMYTVIFNCSELRLMILLFSMLNAHTYMHTHVCRRQTESRQKHMH